MVQRHLLPVLMKRLMVLLMDCTHSPVLHFFMYYSDVIIVCHFCNMYSVGLLRFWALHPKVAFLATIEACAVSTACSASIYIHCVRVSLWRQSLCRCGEVSPWSLVGPLLGWEHSSDECLVLVPSPINGDSHFLPVLQSHGNVLMRIDHL